MSVGDQSILDPMTYAIPTTAQGTAFFSDHSWLLVLGIVLVTTSLLMRARKRRRTQPASLTPSETTERYRQQRGLRGDLESLMVEIEQMAKRLGAQLDAKSVRIERLLHEADETLARLERRRKAAGDTDSPDAFERNPSHRHAGATAAPQTAQRPGRRITTSDDPAADPLARSVYQLADGGMAADQIAQQLNEHIGKVELILALRDA